MLMNFGGAGLASLLLQAAPAIGNGLTSDQKTQIAIESLRHRDGTNALVPVAFFALIILLVWLRMRFKQAQLKAREEFNKQLLDKFNSGREFGEFLESKGGQEFLAGLRTQGQEAKDRVFRMLSVGIIMTMVGLGMLVLTLTKRQFVFPAVLFLALGVGFLLSAWISHRLLNREAQDGGMQGGGGQNQTPRHGTAPVS